MELIITKQSLQNFIPDAVSWAESIWKESSSNWAYRSGQDLNYRTYVINPFLENYIENLLEGRPANVVELGCGDGILLESAKIRTLIGDKGSYTGIDASDTLLEKASKNHPGSNTNFISSDLSDLSFNENISQIRTGWNIIISVFVIQEIADIRTFVKNLSALVNHDVSCILVTVHPDFANWLKEMGRMPLNTDLQPENFDNQTQWRWAGKYPIVDENHDNFYLPYFHRDSGDYIKLFENEGLTVTKVVELPEHDEIRKLSEQKISPFVYFKRNDYWPMIAQEPSAEAFIIQKRKNLV